MLEGLTLLIAGNPPAFAFAALFGFTLISGALLWPEREVVRVVKLRDLRKVVDEALTKILRELDEQEKKRPSEPRVNVIKADAIKTILAEEAEQARAERDRFLDVWEKMAAGRHQRNKAEMRAEFDALIKAMNRRAAARTKAKPKGKRNP